MSAINSSILQSLISSLQAPKMPTNFGTNPVSAFTTMTNQANQANATRGQGILQLLSGQGQAQIAQNQQGYQQQLGQINQDMMSKGLANTSVGNNLQQSALNQLNLSNQGVNENTALNVANMANSFTQQAPDMGLLATLMSKGGGSATPTTGPGGRPIGTFITDWNGVTHKIG